MHAANAIFRPKPGSSGFLEGRSIRCDGTITFSGDSVETSTLVSTGPMTFLVEIGSIGLNILQMYRIVSLITLVFLR